MRLATLVLVGYAYAPALALVPFRRTGVGTSPLFAQNADEAEDAARLYQALAAEEGRRRAKKGFGAEVSVQKKGGRATSGGDVDQSRKMRLKLKALDEELKYNTQEMKTRRGGGNHANRSCKIIETDVNRLKLQLAEARRTLEEKERRAEDAELRVRTLLESPPSPAPIASSLSSPMRGVGSDDADTVESLRAANVAEVEELRAENRRRLSNYEKAAAMDRQSLRNRAWSLETELTKQKTVLEAAREEADEAMFLAGDIEARLIELTEEGDARIDELGREVEGATRSLGKTRERAAGRLMAVRELFRTRLQRQDEEAKETLKAVQEEMETELTKVRRKSGEELLVLKRTSEESVNRAKLEKEQMVGSERERLEAYKTFMDGRFEREKEIVERRVQAAEVEMERQLEDFRATADQEKRTLREEGRSKVAEVQAQVALESRRLLDEMDRKLGAKAIRKVKLEKNLAGSDAALQEYEEERTSLRRLASLAGGLATRKLRLRRKDEG